MYDVWKDGTYWYSYHTETDAVTCVNMLSDTGFITRKQVNASGTGFEIIRG